MTTKIQRPADFPAVAQAQSRRDNAATALADAERQFAELRESDVADSDSQARARAFLDGDAGATDQQPRSRGQRLAQLADRVEVLRNAVSIAENELESAVMAASQETLRRFEPEWRRLQAEVVRATVALADLEAQRHDLVDKILAKGIKGMSACLPILPRSSVGRRDDPHSYAAALIDEASKLGIDVPVVGA